MNKNTKEIFWNIVNSILAGLLVLFGAFTTGNVTIESLVVATGAAAIVAVTQFKDYWSSEKSEYCKRIGTFI